MVCDSSIVDEMILSQLASSLVKPAARRFAALGPARIEKLFALPEKSYPLEKISNSVSY
jgi:hypothetical protein